MAAIHDEEVRTLPHLSAVAGIDGDLAIGLALHEFVQILPVAQIVRAIEQHAAADGALAGANAEIPFVAFLPRAGIAKAGDVHALAAERQ